MGIAEIETPLYKLLKNATHDTVTSMSLTSPIFSLHGTLVLKGWSLVELILFFPNVTKHPKHVSSKQFVSVEETLFFVTFLTVIRLFFLLSSFSLEHCNLNFSACFDLNLMSYSLEMRLK